MALNRNGSPQGSVSKRTVTAKGDIIAATANSTVASLPVGADGTTLVADSSAATGLRYQANFAAGKNAIINGGFDIWQRGTSGFTTTDTYTADRWKVYLGGAGTVSQDTSLVATGSQYAARITSNSAGFVGGVYQSIETSNALLLAGKTVTVSVLIAGTVGKTANINIATSTSTDVAPFGSWTALLDSGPLTVSGSFTKFSATATIPSSAKSVRIGIGTSGSLASTEFLTFDQVQLEIGSVATPFSRAGGTLQGELAACQRYYYSTATGSDNYSYFGIGQAISSSAAKLAFPFPVRMRISPTSVVQTGNIGCLNSGNTAINNGTVTVEWSSNNLASLNITSTSGLTAGNATVVEGNNSATASLSFSAEL